MIRPDSTRSTQITHERGGRIHDSAASWSPDGQQIAFISNRADGRRFQMYVMNADGSNAHQVTTGPEVHGGNWGAHAQVARRGRGRAARQTFPCRSAGPPTVQTS